MLESSIRRAADTVSAWPRVIRPSSLCKKSLAFLPAPATPALARLLVESRLFIVYGK
jgi:hypothetical protein